MPVELADHTDCSKATQEDLQQHAAATRVKVGIDGHLQKHPPQQDEQQDGFAHVCMFFGYLNE